MSNTDATLNVAIDNGEFPLPADPIYNVPDITNVINHYKDISDALMASLKTEYSEGRITANHYADVYIATLNAALGNAMQFEMQNIAIKNGNIQSQAQWESIQQSILANKAQIQDTIGGIEVSGIIGKQREVYASQIAGFKQKALQDAASSLIQTWSVRATNGDAPIGPKNKLCDETIGSFVDALMQTTLPAGIATETCPDPKPKP